MKKLNLTGHVYGMLTVIQEHSKPTNRTMWDCVCECGNTATVQAANLRSGTTTSCGCYRKAVTAERGRTINRTHGMTNTPEYSTYHSMMGRCYRKSYRKWHRYGGRGIAVCDRWRESFENFYADMGDKPTGYLLDRIDNNGSYSPDNCRWADISTSNRNRDMTNVGKNQHCHCAPA